MQKSRLRFMSRKIVPSGFALHWNDFELFVLTRMEANHLSRVATISKARLFSRSIPQSNHAESTQRVQKIPGISSECARDLSTHSSCGCCAKLRVAHLITESHQLQTSIDEIQASDSRDYRDHAHEHKNGIHVKPHSVAVEHCNSTFLLFWRLARGDDALPRRSTAQVNTCRAVYGGTLPLFLGYRERPPGRFPANRQIAAC